MIAGVEYKYCKKCDKWLELACFSDDTYKSDGKRTNCKICSNTKRPICQFEKCNTFANSGYNFCKKHGGGIKCLNCNTLARCGSKYCMKHNPEKCKFEGCDEKPIDMTDFCTLHNDTYRCKFEGCPNQKSSNKNGYCTKHGDKFYCIFEGCNKIQHNKKMCQGHYCVGNISRCAEILVHNSKTNDRLKSRENTISVQDIVDLYTKNKNCHWCSFPVKLECCSDTSFKLDNISLDRLDNIKGNVEGHTKTNCVISCLFCNYARSGCSVEQWKTVISVLNGTLKILDFTKYDGINNISFRTCILVDRDKEYDKEELINTTWLYSQIKKNGWFCELTGLPIYPSTHNYFPWHPSTDRVDNNIGHTKDNCKVVCRFVNLGKNDIETDKFKKWFLARFPNCKPVKTIYPSNFDNVFNKLFDKYDKKTTIDKT